MSVHPDKDHQAVREALENLTSEEMRALGIEALRACRTTSTDGDISIHGQFGRAMVPLLAQTAGTPIDAQIGKEAFLEDQAEPWMAVVVDFLWWMIRAGLLIPRSTSENGNLVRVRLTIAGTHFFDSTPDHPLLPGSLLRVRTRSPGIPDEVIEHLLDAQSCLGTSLARPAIVLIGLAYEVAIDRAVDSLINRGVIPPEVAGHRAAKKIATIRPLIDRVFLKPEDREKLHAANAAWAFADDIRRRRNDASHSRPLYDFEDLSEAEEFFVSALRRLPALWSVVS